MPLDLPSPALLLEIAAFELASALAAAEAGAGRIELCRDASAGGLTPPLEWIEAVMAQTDVPVVAMIRAHADGWTFTDTEHAAMRDDALAAIRAGASGIVWGALRADGTVDEPALRQLVEAVAPHPVVFHRAFDAARDLDEALETLIACGVARVLTGGGAGRALDNVDRLADLVQRAGGRITVMPGGGVRGANVAEIHRRTGAREVHSGASANGDGCVDPVEVRNLRAVLRRAGDSRSEGALDRQVETLGIPRIRRHIALCAGPTKPKCAPAEESLESWTFLKMRLKELGLTGAGGIYRTKANCPAGVPARSHRCSVPGGCVVPLLHARGAGAGHSGAPDRRTPSGRLSDRAAAAANRIVPVASSRQLRRASDYSPSDRRMAPKGIDTSK